MKCEGFVCDICGQHANQYNSIRLVAKSRRFLTWQNYEELGACRKRWDICTTCLRIIKDASISGKTYEQCK